jgi:hypothetical protein
MAKITVTGAVGRVFYQNKGIEVVESYKAQNGDIKTRKFTAWFDAPQNLTEGQTGTFSGNLSATIDEWTNQDGSPKLDSSGKPGRSVKLQINNATFTAGQTPADDFPF